VTLAVATWNVQWQFGAWEQRQAPILATLTKLSAPVIMLQETWRDQAEHIGETLGLETVWAGHDSNDNPARSMGNAILSRWPIQSTHFRFLDDAKGRQYRTIVSAQIETPWGILPAFTTHLDHNFDQSATRIAQLAQASEFIEQHALGDFPPILTGDLNAVHDSDEIRKLTGRSTPYVAGRIWTDAWEQVGQGDGITWSKANPYINNSAWPNRRLDYVMIGWPRHKRPLGNPAHAELFGIEPVDGIVPSDHYGLCVEVHCG